ncbi:uncharacterized protein LOC135930937 [Gordionus sp. m RMFG-2023]|uniref:uncharacterized protein LOC135930937 n=1 Tax=Gordionus sp. m RMFG-2023 TaxID=3053472 RepID=UPI0031FCFEDD
MTGNLCLTLSSNTYENPRSYEIVYPPLPIGISLAQIDKTYYGCDPKSLETNCTIDNCVGAVPCSNNTQIECYNNMCTCSAIWWLGEKIFDCNSKDAYAAPEFQPRKSGIIPAKIIGLFDYRLHYGCENVSELVDCYWEVCDTNTNNQNRVSRPNGGLEDINNGVCQGYPGAECYPNACKKCSAFWWFQYQKVDCDEEYGELKRRNTFDGLNEIGCDGYTCNCDAKLPETTCYHDPCVNATCYLYPRAQCRSHNCFQCEARFYAGDREVKCV